MSKSEMSGSASAGPESEGKKSVSGRKNSTLTPRAKKALRKSVENTIIHLPPIENYMKEVTFTADGTGRVIAKIERLMGSDKIRYFDREWMSEFARVLDIDDAKDLIAKSKMRADNERERSRQLAFTGEILPSAENDLEDIINHPLYKVNVLMKKLEKLDLTALLMSAKTRLPPIVATEPFAEDPSGKIFENYPGHLKYDGGREATLLYKNAGGVPSATDTYIESELNTTPSNVVDEAKEGDEEEDGNEEEEAAAAAVDECMMEFEGEGAEYPYDIPWGDAEGDYDGGYCGQVKGQVSALEVKVQQSLLDLMMDYNIETDDNIFALYSPYRSEIVEDLFAKEENVDELYEMGKNINDLYIREAEKTEKELKALYRTLASSRDA